MVSKRARGLPRWQDLTVRDIGALAARDPVVVLPLAAIEQHGDHLPLSTDLDIGLGLLDACARYLDDAMAVTVLPPVAVGASAEHGNFPGTLSLPPGMVQALVEHCGEAVARTGCRRLMLFNSHGGNRQVADLAALALRRNTGLLVAKLNYFRLPRPPGLLPEAEWRHGLHGGALETALMMALRPEAVRSEAVRNNPSAGEIMEADFELLGPEGPVSLAWLAEDLNAAGVVGDATLASVALGERLVAHYSRLIAAAIAEIAACGLPLADGGLRSRQGDDRPGGPSR